MFNKPPVINYKSIGSLFGYVIHKNYLINTIIYILLNFVIASAILGLLSLFTDVFSGDIVGYILFVLAFSVFDVVLFTLSFYFIPKIIFYSGGALLLGIQMLTIYLSSLLNPNFVILAPVFGRILLLAVLLFVIRWVIAVYLSSILYKGAKL